MRGGSMYDDEHEYLPYVCMHGYTDGCEQCDDALADAEKCLCCGRIRHYQSLNRDQVCAEGCRNPSEH